MVVQTLVSSWTVAVFPQPVALGHFTEVVLVQELALVSLNIRERSRSWKEKGKEGKDGQLELAFVFDPSSLRAEKAAPDPEQKQMNLPSYTVL